MHLFTYAITTTMDTDLLSSFAYFLLRRTFVTLFEHIFVYLLYLSNHLIPDFAIVCIPQRISSGKIMNNTFLRLICLQTTDFYTFSVCVCVFVRLVYFFFPTRGQYFFTVSPQLIRKTYSKNDYPSK